MLWCNKADGGPCLLSFECGHEDNNTAYLSSLLMSTAASLHHRYGSTSAESEISKKDQVVQGESSRFHSLPLEDKTDPDLWEFAKERAHRVLSSHEEKTSSSTSSVRDEEDESESTVVITNRSGFTSRFKIASMMSEEDDYHHHDDDELIFSSPATTFPSSRSEEALPGVIVEDDDDDRFFHDSPFDESKDEMEWPSCRNQQPRGEGGGDTTSFLHKTAHDQNDSARECRQQSPTKCDRHYEMNQSRLFDSRLIAILAKRKQKKFGGPPTLLPSITEVSSQSSSSKISAAAAASSSLRSTTSYGSLRAALSAADKTTPLHVNKRTPNPLHHHTSTSSAPNRYMF